MNDNAKTQEQLIQELEALRQQVATLQESESERRLAEAALRISEERFALAVQGSNDGLWDWNIQSRSLYWSPRFKELLGYAEDELEIDFDKFASLLHPDDTERVNAALDAHLKDRAPYDVEERRLAKSGEYRWFRARGQAVWDQAGNPVRMTGSISDITERKQAEAEHKRLLADLERRALQLQTAAEVSRAAGSILDPNELTRQVTSLACERFNLYYAGLFLVDQTGEWAVLRAGAGEAGQKMLKAGHKLEVGGASMIGWCTAHGQARIALDVGKDAVRFDNPLLSRTRSEMALPLICRGQVIGAMTIQSDQPAAFTPEDIAALQTMSDQLANAIENARLFEETQSRLAQLATLQETAKAVASTLELDKLLHLITEQAATLLQGDGGVINLTDWEKKEDEVVAASGTATFALGFRSSIDTGLSGWVARHNQPLISNQLATDSLAQPISRARVQNCIIAPLTIRDEVIGTLVVHNKKVGQENFNQADLEILMPFANQAAIAIQNARLFEESQTRSEELAVLNEMSRALTSRLDAGREAVVESLYQHASRLIDTTNFFIALYTAENDEISFPLAFERGQRRQWARRQARQGLTEHVIHTRVPLLIEENVSERLKELNIESIGEPALSWLGVPMTSGGKVIGVIAAQSYTTPRLYNERRRDLLSAVASQAAIALQNADLLEEASRRAEQMTVLNRIGLAITSGLGMDHVLTTLYEQCSQVASIDSFYIALYDEASGLIHFPLFHDKERYLSTPSLDIRTDSSLTCHIVLSRQTFYSPDMLDPDTPPPIPLVQVSPVDIARSFLGVPLILRDKVIGVVSMQSDQPNAYTPDDIRLLETLGSQAAIAIENARLFEQTRTTLAELRASEERLTLAMEGTNDGLWDWDIRGQSLYWSPRFKELLGYVPDELEVSFDVFTSSLHPDDRERVNAVLDAHLKDRAPYDVEERLLAKSGEYRWFRARGEAARDEAGNPVRMTGAITDITESKEAEAERERLLTVLERRALQLQTAAEVSRAASSILNVDELLPQVVELIRARFNLYYTGLFLVDESVQSPGHPLPLKGTLGAGVWAILRAGTGEAGRAMITAGHKLKVDISSMVGSCIIQGKAHVAQDVGKAIRFQNPLLPETHSEMALPLTSRGRVIGAMTIQSTQSAAFTQEDTTVLQTMTDQVANAIENARLFEQARARAEEMAVLEELSRALTGLLNVQEVFKEAYRGTVRIMQADSFYIAMYDPEKDEISFPFEMIEQVRVYSPSRRAGKGLSEYVVRTRAPLLIQENPSEWAAKHGCEFFDYIPLSWLGVPIMIGDRVLGALVIVNRNNPHVYDEHHQSLLMSIASQTAVAIQNARLFEETKAALAEVEATHRRYLREQWKTFLTSAAERILGYADGPDGLIPAGDESLAVAPATGAGSLRVPIRLRDEPIGVLEFLDLDTARTWSEDELTLVQALADQAGLALENARLSEQTQRLAGRERLINEITARIRASTGVPGILQTAARELATAMNVPHAVARIRVKTDEMENEDRTA